MEDLSETLNKEKENIKNHSEMKNSVMEISGGQSNGTQSS